MGEATSKDLMSPQALAKRLKALPGWSLDEKREAIRRRLIFEDFNSAFCFMTDVAAEAERVNHHPEWCNVWNRVDVVLTTHSAGGLTGKDISLAQLIDEISGNYALQCDVDNAGNCGGCV